MFPSVLGVNLSEKDKSINSCFVSTNLDNCGLLQDLARTIKHKPEISSCTINSLQVLSEIKKKRNLPGNPDPNAEVIALSPNTLLATNRFVCEICQKGFQRDQNLQLHRRGHNLPWKLKQRSSREIRKKAYVCPVSTCVHHNPSRALGDLTGIKKHYSRKHGEKKWNCEKCSKTYAVHSDWKAHSKICGTKEYRCDCGTLFTRKDSFITHRAFCDALAQESARISANTLDHPPPHHHPQTLPSPFPFPQLPPDHHLFPQYANPLWDLPITLNSPHIKTESLHLQPLSSATYYQPPSQLAYMSATALLQKAASLGSHPVGHVVSSMAGSVSELDMWRKGGDLTRDFLGLAREDSIGDLHNGAVEGNVHTTRKRAFSDRIHAHEGEMPTYNGVVEYESDHTLIKGQRGFGFATEPTWG